MNTYLFNGHVVTASNKDELLNPKRVIAKNKRHLRELINEAIDKYGNGCDLNFIDVSHVTEMGSLFSMTNGAFGNFNGDISKWNVSNVTNMHDMFERSEFNGDISKWLPMMEKNGINLRKLGFQIKKDTWDDLEV